MTGASVITVPITQLAAGGDSTAGTVASDFSCFSINNTWGSMATYALVNVTLDSFIACRAHALDVS